MSDPTFRPLVTGDTHDDDAEYIDDLFQQQPSSIDPAASNVLVRDESKTPTKPARLLSGFATYAIQTDAAMLIPGDPNRTQLHLRVSGSNTETAFVHFGDQSTDLAAISGGSGLCFRMYVGDKICIDNFNGPLWFALSGVPVAAIVISWTAVTK